MSTVVSIEASSNTLREYKVGCQGTVTSKLVLFGCFVGLRWWTTVLGRELGLTHR